MTASHASPGIGEPEKAGQCSGCGLIVPGGTAGCQAVFEEISARGFSHPAWFRVHRLVVDTYCLQHPDRYCVSGKSLAAHLASLCQLLEHGGNRATGSEALRRWLDGAARIAKPELPSFRGERTIADVRAAPDPDAYARAVEGWARSTWDAYAALQPLARDWVRQAFAGRRSRLARLLLPAG